MAKDSRTKQRAEHWKETPDDHDFPAASDYLSLTFTDELTAVLVDRLRRAPVAHRKAKDLLRASDLALLGEDNFHVAADLDKVRKGRQLSPVLLVRGDALRDVPLIVADGYHRICASYHIDENADVPCKIVELIEPAPPPTDSTGHGG